MGSGSNGSLTGRVLAGKWRVGRLIGRGGTSTVYAATHRIGKEFAIKVLHPELAPSERARRRFIREAYIANRVKHDAVPAIFDDGVEGEVVFLVMDLLDGSTVEEYRRACGGRLIANEALAIGERLLDVLTAAHAMGVVHRDVKPSNLFLTHGGSLKLLDFGIARLHEDGIASDQTGSGALLGTPGFVAPEQARGRFRDVDARTDIWAVGATLFRLLTSKHVHGGETANEMVIAAATRPAPRLATVDAEHEALGWIVDRALAQDPEHRFQRAEDMLDAVRSELGRRSNPALPRPLPSIDDTRNDESAPSGAARGSSASGAWSAALAQTSRVRPAAGIALGVSMLLVLLVVAIALLRRGEPGVSELPPRTDEPHRTFRVEGARAESATAPPAEQPTPRPTAPSARVRSARTKTAPVAQRAAAATVSEPTRAAPAEAARLEDVLDARE